jgi:hypothetical protein
VPHYAYLKLKLPGNNGTNITVHESFSRSDNCDREFQKIAAKFGIKQEMKTVDFIPKQLALENKESKLKEVDNNKKTKKQPDDPATTVPTVKTSAAVVSASTEVTNPSAAIANASTETIGTAQEAIGTSTYVSETKEDPPLT